MRLRKISLERILAERYGDNATGGDDYHRRKSREWHQRKKAERERKTKSEQG